jgi:hypothetical protein
MDLIIIESILSNILVVSKPISDKLFMAAVRDRLWPLKSYFISLFPMKFGANLLMA